MFSKISRYRRLDDVATTDAAGSMRIGKELRPAVTATGTFLHTVSDSDRVDLLAHKYYQQPRQWWHVCDANPQFFSPQQLLGKQSVVSARFAVTIAGTPPWSAVLATLRARVGVEDASVEEQFTIEQQTSAGNPVLDVELVQRSLVVRFNRANVDAAQLATIIVAAGFQVGEPQLIGRAGKQIIIPPPPGGTRS